MLYCHDSFVRDSVNNSTDANPPFDDTIRFLVEIVKLER